jgi:hypothetical protein
MRQSMPLDGGQAHGDRLGRWRDLGRPLFARRALGGLRNSEERPGGRPVEKPEAADHCNRSHDHDESSHVSLLDSVT